MKLSKTLLAVLTPVAAVSAVAPIASCGSSLEIKFGDSINFLSKDKKYKEIAKYHKREEVYQAAKLNAIWVSPGTLVKAEEINASKTIETVYFDLICSICISTELMCIESKWNDDDQKFDTFNIYLQQTDEEGKPVGEISEKLHSNITLDDFVYEEVTGDEGKFIGLSFFDGELFMHSYSYQEAIVED